ncbi:MAG: 4-hydroxybenzoyl-CoA thioesterase, partial [Burkholderiales bacterium]|nr:4-hydroxybenzoyl-CoA thioesterase [Burkholderiales bacterium]
ALGFTQRALAAREGIIFVVRSLSIEYMKPSRIDDNLQVTVEPVKVGAGQIIVAQEVRREAEVLVGAEVRLACVNAATLKPVRIPQAVIIRTGTIS